MRPIHEHSLPAEGLQVSSLLSASFTPEQKTFDTYSCSTVLELGLLVERIPRIEGKSFGFLYHYVLISCE